MEVYVLPLVKSYLNFKSNAFYYVGRHVNCENTNATFHIEIRYFFECTSIEARIMCVRQQPEYCEENLHCLYVLPVSAYYESEVNKCNCEAKAECELIDTSLGP
jgi:hypothetical protein